MTLSVQIRTSLGDFRLDAAFQAPPGITALFGRSGSGKTSIINAVAGLSSPDEGCISVDGRTLFDATQGISVPVHKRRLGYVFQEARLFPHLSVSGNLKFGQRFAPRKDRWADTARVVDLLGLGTLLDRRPVALSGGEKQRVAIGRAILSSPDLLLADEPLSALDEGLKAEILPYFERLRDDLKVPILYVSHSVTEVARLATTVVAIQDGRVVQQGSAESVLADPAVLPTGVRDAGAVLEAVVATHHPDGLTELAAGEETFFVPGIDKAPGTPIRVRVAAQDVILSSSKPEGLSALNTLKGRVVGIRMGDGPGAIVSLETSAGSILARITRRSAISLDVQEGREFFAVIKTVGIAPADVGAGFSAPGG